MSLFLHSRLFSQAAQHLSTTQRVRGLSSRAFNLYEVLGVERTCPQEQIKVAFYRQAKKMHPDIQRDEEADRQAEKFIRLAAAYEVLRDPTRRATYDAHLSSRSKFVKSAFDFDPPTSETNWPEDPIGDSHVAPWVRQYRQAVREVVKYGGEGEGLAHLVRVEFGAAVRKAYFGPEVGALALGEWPMEFEGEERSVAGLGDVMHIVSGRQLLGTVREARDVLLGHGVNGRPKAVLEAGESKERIGAGYELGASEIGLGEGENRSCRPVAGTAGESKNRVEAESGVRKSWGGSEKGDGNFKGFRARDFDGGLDPNAVHESRAEAGCSVSKRASGEEARSPDDSDASRNAAQSSADYRPRTGAQTREMESGTESGTEDRARVKTGEGRSHEFSERNVDRRDSGDEVFATLELTQHGEVVGVATREWVPLTEIGSRSGTAIGEATGEEVERIDCISIYAVNRGVSAFAQNDDEERKGPEDWDRRDAEEREKSTWKYETESSSGLERESGSESCDAAGSRSGRATENGTDSASRRGNGLKTECGNENVYDRGEAANGIDNETRNGSASGSGSGFRNGTGDGHREDGWAEDIERLEMRYRKPRLLARIFGLRDGRPSTDVFREGGEKTHMLLQHRTPLVRHMAWYRSDVDKRGRRIRRCEARLRRAAMLPSSLWLFEPRASTHDCGGWYFERFDEEETRGAPSFAHLTPLGPQRGRGLLETKHAKDSGFAHNSHRLAEREYSGTTERSRGSSRVSNRHQHSRHSLRFNRPSESVKAGSEDEDSRSSMTAQDRRFSSFIATPLDPAVYILTAAYLTLDKEQEVRTAKPSAVADLLQKGAKWTGEIRNWWQSKVGA
ncbi:hypothetical protein KFL_000640020 [Klebsormidium nitens]|uniref:J domain-containing protein n=1 Tax=Klebsormidium nitens TaxID=105231 RepID=A0A1Y1HWF7_KLENI|nr:hypothetical protein KFL_000640020 [Klebsormidium nitens]|eukprot:GAQ80836.1 hypothetical protein KFL_000640020 [Klebsormidium nitens]